MVEMLLLFCQSTVINILFKGQPGPPIFSPAKHLLLTNVLTKITCKGLLVNNNIILLSASQPVHVKSKPGPEPVFSTEDTLI
jgi:hypothetical protein